MSSSIGVQRYYKTIRDRLKNYIKSDYLANSETLLLYSEDLLGERCSEHPISLVNRILKRRHHIRRLQTDSMLPLLLTRN